MGKWLNVSNASSMTKTGYPKDWKGFAMLVKYGDNMELNALEQRTNDRIQDIIRDLTAKGGWTVKKILAMLKKLEQFGLLGKEAFIRAIGMM